MLGYYDPVISDGCTISVDRLSIQFNVIDDLVDMLRTDHYLKGVFPWLNYEDIDTRRYHFRYYYKVTYHSGIMTVMLCHNSNEQCKCRIEVNPNKCFNDPNCIHNIQELLMYSSEYYINQLDVAIDIPKSPDLISFLKDQRSSLQYSRGKNDQTEYLGKKRNKPGHVKKYDKAKESDLDHPLTRIEVTVGNPADCKFRNDLIRYLPETYVRVSTEKAVDLNSDTLNATEKVLIKALLSHPNGIALWSQMCKKEKEKIKPYIFSELENLNYDIETIIKVANEMISILNFDCARLENGIFKV